MNLETIWTNKGVGIGEKCLLNKEGDFIGASTGIKYSKEEHYASKKIKAIVKNIDENQVNGMVHLDPLENEWKKKYNYVGCEMTFREAHYFGDIKVYASMDTGEYYNQNELEIL